MLGLWRGLRVPLAALMVVFFGACDEATEPQAQDPVTTGATKVSTVDAARIIGADKEPHNWLSHGRTYSEQRYSPLDKINADNVAQLGLAWFYDMPERRGIEATPLVIDGRLYATSAWSAVYAMDAKTGKELWSFDPEVPRSRGSVACCDVVNRGVAAWGDKIYVGTIDGRLIALNASDGKVAWSVDTIDKSKPYTITGAPRVIKGKVIIGNGGAEFGVRGYITAYDAETGEQAWRFYTVPGNPADGFEDKAQEAAAKTWTGEWWKFGGGGTAWDAMAYDPELDLLYIGTGNGSPWNQQIRSPQGGDNLYLSSIVAIRPETGEYVWHYQTTPGDTWDFTATQHVMLLDLEIDGQMRKTVVQAPKNGFFYVIDRATGELISANNYVPVNWAEKVDLKTGRPVETENARYKDPEKPQLIVPSAFGGHNWHPMAYSPKTGLVYLSAQEVPMVYGLDKTFKFEPGYWNLGINFALTSLPEDKKEAGKLLKLLKGRLLAWDPVKNAQAFAVEHPGPWNGGILATAGDLVFQGTPGGEFAAYNAANGTKLWSSQAQTGVVSGPIAFEVDGEQYISVTVGWGTAFAMVAPGAVQNTISRVLTFKVGGKVSLPPVTAPAAAVDFPAPPPVTGTPEQIAEGKQLYLTRCFQCHGDAAMSSGVISDLRKLSPESHAAWDDYVRGNQKHELGMPKFDKLLTEAQSEAIHQYVIKRAHDTRTADAKQ